jgi:hypothetical protein
MKKKNMQSKETAHDRSVCASASAVARSFRCDPFPRRCSGTFCQPWSLLRKAFIRAAKPLQTARTKREIIFEICRRIY